MDVKLQIEDAIVFYHGKQVFVRMIKKKEKFIENEGQSFLNLLGLDCLDKNGNYKEFGDDKLDSNPYLIDYQHEILIFPSVNPFNPLESNQYKIPEKYYTDIYSSTSMHTLADIGRFELTLTYYDN